VTFIALRDFPMPIFDQDLEAANGMPAEAKKLKELFLKADGLIIASPEYNSSVTDGPEKCDRLGFPG
jgi:chromate reductase